jgi:hypothetical protein
MASLSPENLTVRDTANGFRTDWIEKCSPIQDDAESIVIIGEFSPGNYDPVDVVIARDETGNGQADSLSEVVTINEGNRIIEIQESRTGEPFVDYCGTYQLRFPGFSQTDPLKRLNFALTWDNQDELNKKWDIPAIDPENGSTADLLSIILSANYRVDSTLDEIYEKQHIELSNGLALDLLAKEVGTTRKAGEKDPHLRKRVLVKSATRTFSTTGEDTTDLIALIFGEDANKITIDVANGEPVLKLQVQQQTINNNPLSAAEIEDLLDEAVPSSYRTNITVQ